MLLKNKNILVTGAARGIGNVTAVKCLEEGANVILNYRAKNVMTDNITSSSGYNQKLYLIQADVSSPDDVSNMMGKIKKKYGKIDGIVNNAGVISRTKDWKNIPYEDWKRMIDTNLLGVWNVIRFGEELMKKGGSIVNVSSIYGLFPEADELTYSISKAGVNAITLALAKKLAPDIRVNSIAPGNTITSMIPCPDKLKNIENNTLLKRSAEPIEIANSIVYLLSDLSTYITGNIIAVDGGYHVI